MKNIRERGITLVALVVTIIILLILAGISIATLTGSGLFENARKAEEKTKEAQEREDTILSDYENKIQLEISSSSRNDEEIKKQKTMSYDEHFTGEYYLDGKPIYAKTVNVGNYPNASAKNVPHNISNYETIWIDMSNSYVIREKDSTIASSVHIGSSAGFSTFIYGDYIRLSAVDNRTDFVGIITIKYTKTTD